jgi:hypothetical protein
LVAAGEWVRREKLWPKRRAGYFIAEVSAFLKTIHRHIDIV